MHFASRPPEAYVGPDEAWARSQARRKPRFTPKGSIGTNQVCRGYIRTIYSPLYKVVRYEAVGYEVGGPGVQQFR